MGRRACSLLWLLLLFYFSRRFSTRGLALQGLGTRRRAEREEITVSSLNKVVVITNHWWLWMTGHPSLLFDRCQNASSLIGHCEASPLSCALMETIPLQVTSFNPPSFCPAGSLLHGLPTRWLKPSYLPQYPRNHEKLTCPC